MTLDDLELKGYKKTGKNCYKKDGFLKYVLVNKNEIYICNTVTNLDDLKAIIKILERNQK